MELSLLRQLLIARLRDRAAYVLPLIVGTLINLYGQVLVPLLRGNEAPVALFVDEVKSRPGVVAVSVGVAYLFPFGVALYSTVSARYQSRRLTSVADFPDLKPDPVFRATPAGDIVEAGESTLTFFERYRIASAQDLVGAEVWQAICGSSNSGKTRTIYFPPEDRQFLVQSRTTSGGRINVYMTRLP